MQQDDGAAHAGPRSETAASSADAKTENGKMTARIMDIAKTDTTPITFSRIIIFVQSGRSLAGDGAWRKVDDVAKGPQSPQSHRFGF
jgi:hypothetical protein